MCKSGNYTKWIEYKKGIWYQGYLDSNKIMVYKNYVFLRVYKILYNKYFIFLKNYIRFKFAITISYTIKEMDKEYLLHLKNKLILVILRLDNYMDRY